MATDKRCGNTIKPPRLPILKIRESKTEKEPSKTKEVIVYLDDYVYGKDNIYETVFLDFRTDKDLAAFKDFISGSDEETKKYLNYKDEGYLEITNYHSPKRLTVGAYYALNVKLLKKLKAELHRDKRLLLLSYNLNNCNNQLLLPHGPLQPDNIQYDEPQKPELPDCFLYNDSLNLKVNNVGQANWNEIIANKATTLVYDMGAPINATVQDVKNYIEEYTRTYQQDSPWLMISHWDKDHIHCLCVMTDDELKWFKGVICPFNMKSVVSKRLFVRIKNSVGPNKMFSFKNRLRDHRFEYPRLQKIFENRGIWLFLGEESRNINYSGIVMIVSGNKSHAVLTGDCLNVQACIATRFARFIGRASKGHVLIVPHHGGKLKKQSVFNYFRLSGGTHPRNAIVSVGKNNLYGHPDNQTITFFENIMGNFVERTDVKEESIKVSLSEDFFSNMYLDGNYLAERMQDNK